MALISPTLDNRDFEQLRDELVRRIPVYAPEWTDHNESDPGIALLELFAYLGESLLYRFNQIPDTTKIAFLRLLGVRQRPAQTAHVLLAATTEEPAGVQVLAGTLAQAGAVEFETAGEVYVWPLNALGVGKTPKQPEQTAAGQASSADALARAGVAPNNAAFYESVVLGADPLAADAPIIDVSAQVDQALWVALLRKRTTDERELRGRIIFVGIAFDEQIENPVPLVQLGPVGTEKFHTDELSADPPPMIWRLWNGPPAPALAQLAPAQPAFTTLTVVGDTTKGLVTTGVVAVQLPEQLSDLGAWQRAASRGGVDSPPPLADEKVADDVLAWIQVGRPASAAARDAVGRVRWVGLNAVSADQARHAVPELLGTGTGDSDQQYALSHQPVLAGTVDLQVEEQDGWVPWDEVDRGTVSKPTDRHFVVDADDGVVTFGRERVPQLGERIRVLTYRYGGGAAGDVAAGAVNSFPEIARVSVTNPFKAAGGADMAPLNESLEDIPAHVHRRNRAVVAADFTALAEEVGGVKRADTLRLFHPDNPLIDAAGVISVVVFPEEDQRNPKAPQPDLGLLRRTARYLDARRLVTTELYVIPPEYVPVLVSVGVAVRKGYQVDAVRRWVEQIVRQYLAPLPPFGPDGDGWPLGRTVRAAELAAVAVQVDGVEYLEGQGLLLATPHPVSPPGAPPAQPPTPRPEVILQRWQVPELVEVTVVAGPPLPPGQDYHPQPPAKTPVPLPPDVC